MSSNLTLRIDAEGVEGYISNIARWHRDYSPIERADLLRDWIYLLEQEYNKTLEQIKIEGLIEL